MSHERVLVSEVTNRITSIMPDNMTIGRGAKRKIERAIKDSVPVEVVTAGMLVAISTARREGRSKIGSFGGNRRVLLQLHNPHRRLNGGK